MGQAFTRPEEAASLGGSFIRSPMTSWVPSNGQHTDKCFDFELRWTDCCEAYGPHAGKEKCKFLWQDYMECGTNWKQLERARVMRIERKKQHAMGVVGMRPYKPKYEDPPWADSCNHSHDDHS